MSPTELSSVFGGHTYVGIILAVLSGIALSLGTQYQHRGVEKVDRAYPASAVEMLRPLCDDRTLRSNTTRYARRTAHLQILFCQRLR